MSDEDEICRKCGAEADDHFTSWERGIPVVGSYKDAPNGRVCSPDMAALILQNGEQARTIRNVQRALARNKNREINMGEAWALINEAVGATEKKESDPECTCSIDGTPFCKAMGTGYCKAENPS